ncbi:hypothetical protein PHLGIDRAFT_38235 [Phlebiopsis gigantea 11061_1 CR5-6]|uniref:Zn(2)-C6 fungal-type domain-containing protein n=1 Tax=Phlebiopsis gigantea (strain 11061_1 CR5-6) TaxID=745531 RepID=A0A0C3NAU0_PHLG1|nr:hypothetical protein PHLGIDRAFT_38235 [Phlebiopsis gigantea 11061_1 CR5-6]
MATTSSPPSPLYEPAHRPMFVHAHQPYYAFAPAPARQPHAAYFCAPADANSLPHDPATHSQVCPSSQYYGDAAPGVIPYAAEYISHSGHDWLPHKQQHHHADSTQAYAAVAHLPPFYDSGEVSPASDDSSGGFYDSPHPSDDARLGDERCSADAHAHATFPAYDPAASFPSPSLITAERYSYLDGELQPHPSPTYYDEPAPLVFQPAPQHLGAAFAHDFSGSADDADALHAHHPHRYLERPPSGASRPSPARYGDAPAEPQRGARTSPHGYAPQQQRTQSPMAHLPYVDPYHGAPDAHAQAFYLPSPAAPYAYAEQPPMCLPPPYHPAAAHTPIAIPAPRSPPLVEDTPKKPLTLACFFCRKRKIACGSPQPGRKDRTCNQCARRNLRCEYPVNSRRGTRQREVESALYPGSAGYERISS